MSRYWRDYGERHSVFSPPLNGRASQDVECKPVDFENEPLPGAPPPLRAGKSFCDVQQGYFDAADPTMFVDESGARGSAVECSLTVT